MGHFSLICRGDESIGFVKLRKLHERGVYEIVYAVGDETLWGRGYGESALRAALSMAFLERRAQSIIAKIHPENRRSVRTARACGFQRYSADTALHLYGLTMSDYLRQFHSH